MGIFLKGYAATRAIKASGLNVLAGEKCPEDVQIPVDLFNSLVRNKRLVVIGTTEERAATQARLSQAPAPKYAPKAPQNQQAPKPTGGAKPTRRSRKDADAKVKDAEGDSD